MAGPGYCQNDAGILENDKLTKGAKDAFIKEIKNELKLGTAHAPVSLISIGPNLPPFPFADLIDLEDEEKYPGFHKNVLGMYEQIANALNIQGQFMFAPIIMDPIAFATKLGLEPPSIEFPDDFVKLAVNFPELAIKLGFKTPADLAKLVAKIPSILVPAPPIPKIPIPIEIDPIAFKELYLFSAWPLKLPNVFLELIMKMPQLLIGIIQLDFKPIAEVIIASKLFGEAGPTSPTMAVAIKILVRKMTECMLIALVGGSVGSSSGGITGALGTKFGYRSSKN